MTLSKNQRKLITSLAQKKYRQAQKLFVVEGEKVVNEFLTSHFQLHSLYATDNFHTDLPVVRISEAELKKISQLKSPNKVVAIFSFPETKQINENGLILALDAINIPGNLGAIVRLCDWFGIDTLVCSDDTVDCYNSKTIQASMGSLTRVNIHYIDLKQYLTEAKKPIYIADMIGENIYQTKLEKEAILVMGNEANGISDDIRKLAQHQISIPRFGNTQLTESLNVATATAILLSEFKR